MQFYKCALICAVLALCILDPITARKSFGGGRSHSYPKSGGLSGGGSHGYPSSGGLSGGGHGYPSSGGSHGYPSSGGLSGGGRGYPSSGGSHSYPSSGNSHGYPSSGGLSGSGSHGYPGGKGVSGNTGSVTNVHHHYHYSPPKQISYTPTYGGRPQSYPVYQGTPPTYVYQYKDSGSKYGTLLAGLALLNLGTLAGTAYAISKTNGNGGTTYKPQPGEYCKFGVKKDNGDYEETKIDCQLITSFIFEEQAKAQSGVNNTSVTTTTVTNVTMVNTTNGVVSDDGVNKAVAPNPIYEMLPNGTLVPVNVTSTNTTANTTGDASNNGVSSSVTITTTTTNTTVANALDVKGKPIDVTPGMKCYVIRHSPVSNMRKSVPCGLLQTYADKSLTKNSAVRGTGSFTIVAVMFAVFLMY